MTKARTAFAVAILLAVALPLTMVAQTEAPPAQPQGQMGGPHDHMGRMGGPPSAQQHLDHLSRMLNLTDDQKAKIKPILEDTTAQAQSLSKDTSLSPQDRHAKMRLIHRLLRVHSHLQRTRPKEADQLVPFLRNWLCTRAAYFGLCMISAGARWRSNPSYWNVHLSGSSCGM